MSLIAAIPDPSDKVQIVERAMIHHQRLYSVVKGKTRAKTLHHSCGSVHALLQDLVESAS